MSPGHNKPRHAAPSVVVAAMLTTVVLLLNGCGGNSTPGQSTTNSHAASPSDDTQSLWADFTKTVDLPSVPLRAPMNLKPVAGFKQADVRALASRALDVLTRSAQPKLSHMSPADAVNYVYAHQYPATTYDFKANATGFTSGYDWQWLAASRYTSTPSLPKIVKVTGAVSTGRGTLETGARARYLTVTLQAHIVQTVQTKRYGAVPIVVRRTVQASGYKPRGGPDWWPSVTARASPYGNRGCELFNGANLVPITQPSALRKDLADLKNSLDSTTVIAENYSGDGDANKTKSYVKKTCEGEDAG